MFSCHLYTNNLTPKCYSLSKTGKYWTFGIQHLSIKAFLILWWILSSLDLLVLPWLPEALLPAWCPEVTHLQSRLQEENLVGQTHRRQQQEHNPGHRNSTPNLHRPIDSISTPTWRYLECIIAKAHKHQAKQKMHSQKLERLAHALTDLTNIGKPQGLKLTMSSFSLVDADLSNQDFPEQRKLSSLDHICSSQWSCQCLCPWSCMSLHTASPFTPSL